MNNSRLVFDKPPAIVVLAFNRPTCLKRLLKSLNEAIYPVGQSIPLILSVDGRDSDVVRVCNEFDWRFGNKQIEVMGDRLGTKEHVFICGDYSHKHGSIIMLEDDLVVSPCFYQYATGALGFYQNESSVAGFSLYHHQLNETSKRAFIPIPDQYDVYFLQLAASWGQFWSADQWKRFRDWCELKTYKDLESLPIPWDVKKWPRSSWKKWFIAYLVDSGKYVVYPRYSYSTNFMEPGVNNPRKDADYQTVLDHSERKWIFTKVKDSKSVYDSYCEIEPSILKKANPKLSSFDFEVDTAGCKTLSDCRRPYILTVRPCHSVVFGFERSLRPEVSNVFCDLDGDALCLVKVDDVCGDYDPVLIDEVNYSYSVPRKLMGRIILEHIENKPITLALTVLLRLVWKKIVKFFVRGKKTDNCKTITTSEKTGEQRVLRT